MYLPEGGFSLLRGMGKRSLGEGKGKRYEMNFAEIPDLGYLQKRMSKIKAKDSVQCNPNDHKTLPMVPSVIFTQILCCTVQSYHDVLTPGGALYKI